MIKIIGNPKANGKKMKFDKVTVNAKPKLTPKELEFIDKIKCSEVWCKCRYAETFHGGPDKNWDARCRPWYMKAMKTPNKVSFDGPYTGSGNDVGIVY